MCPVQMPALKSRLCEPSSLHGLTLIYGGVLALLTYLRVCSAFYFTVSLLFLLVFRRLVWDGLLKPVLPTTHLSNAVFVTCEALSVSVPFILSTILVSSILEFFIPLMGRSGTRLPPDLAIGVLTAVVVCLPCSKTVSISYQHNSYFYYTIGEILNG